MPPELHSFQRDFAAAIGRQASGPLRIYRNTVIHGAVEALRANYPVVAHILGAEMFESLGVDYAAAFPPRTPVLALYGQQFAEWLEERCWIGEFPYLADVARIERLHIECLFAADAEPLHLSELQDCDWNRLKLKLHPAARFDWLMTPAVSIWLAHQQSKVAEIAPDWHGEGVIFTRPGLSLWPTSLDAASYRLLLGLRNGATVGAAAQAAAEVDAQADVGALFATLVTAGAFVAPIPGGNSQ